MDIPITIINKLTSRQQFLLKAEGVSMLPLLQSGDTLEFIKKSFKNIEVNDIIFAVKNGKYFIHRVIYKNKNYLITKGDNNQTADGKIKPKQIKGFLQRVIRGKNSFRIDDIYLIQSTLYFKEILKITKAFKKEKIDFVFLKGLPLYLFLKKIHPRRIYADCDILVDKDKHENVKNIFTRFGYMPADGSISPALKKLKKFDSEINYYRKVQNYFIVFDIHFRAFTLISQFDSLDELYPEKLIVSLTRDFLREKQFVDINSEKYPVLSYDNMVLFLCLHILSHNYKGIFRWEILKVVIKRINRTRSDNVYKNFVDKVNKYKLGNYVFPAIILLKKYYGIQIPKRYYKNISIHKIALIYFQRFISKTNIFMKEERINAGMLRFSNLFFLSPLPYPVKLSVLTDIRVVFSAFFVMSKKFKAFFRYN